MFIIIVQGLHFIINFLLLIIINQFATMLAIIFKIITLKITKKKTSDLLVLLIGFLIATIFS